MTVFTFHLAKTKISTTARVLCCPPTRMQVPGLSHAECMAKMTLGAPIFSPARMQLHHLAMFAAWESHLAIDEFLASTRLGRVLANGWHVRMAFQRRWGHISEFDGLAESVDKQDPAAPVVAVTLARMKLPQVPRFIRWGQAGRRACARPPRYNSGDSGNETAPYGLYLFGVALATGNG